MSEIFDIKKVSIKVTDSRGNELNASKEFQGVPLREGSSVIEAHWGGLCGDLDNLATASTEKSERVTDQE